MPDMREEFEKEYDWPSLDERQRLIVDGSCWSVWQKAWQASRAALKVELPKPEGIYMLDLQKYVLDRCKQTLQQAGIEVKQP